MYMYVFIIEDVNAKIGPRSSSVMDALEALGQWKRVSQ